MGFRSLEGFFKDFFPNSDSELKGSNGGSKERTQNPPQGGLGGEGHPIRTGSKVL